MIFVKTKLDKSNIHGIGIFSKEFIPKGALVWKFDPVFDVVLTKDQVDKLSDAAKEQFLNYAYESKKTRNYVLCSDDSRFFNHVSTPNTSCYVPEDPDSDEALVCFATKDIEAGEELTNNYAEFDNNPSDVII